MVDLAFKSLLHDRLRFLITLMGVAFAVTLVFMQVGMFEGLLSYAEVTIRHADADIWVASRNTPNIDFAEFFPESYVERVRSVAGVQRADNLIVTYLPVALPNGATENAVIYALQDFTRWNIPWKISEGDIRNLKRGRYFFLDESASRRMGAFKVGEYRELLYNRFKIAGRTQEAQSFTTSPVGFMDYDMVQTLNPTVLSGRTTYIIAKAAPGADVKAVQREIQRRLPYNDVYTSDEWAKRSRNYWVVSTGLGLNMFVTVFLGCLVGVVVVTQTLYTSTMEHIKEYGTVKAIGGSNLDIYAIVAKQALIAAVGGYLVALGMVAAMRPVLQKIQLSLVISNEFGVIVFVGTVLLCLASSVVSFKKVASIDPALVFRA